MSTTRALPLTLRLALAALALGVSLPGAAQPRTGGPGGSDLDQWFKELFDTGANPLGNVELVNTTNGVQRAIAINIGVICPELNQAVAGGAVLGAGSADLRARCNEIVEDLVDNPVPVDAATQADALEGLQEMGAEENSVIANTEVDFSAAHEGHVSARMSDIRAGLGGTTIALRGLDHDLRGMTGGNAGTGMAGWSFFVDATFGRADKDPTSLESGFDADSTTITVGADYRLSTDLVTGMALGYTDLEADLDNDGGELDTRSRSLFIYTTWYGRDGWYLDGMLGYTHNDHDQERNIRYSISGFGIPALTQVDNTADSSNDSDEWSFSLQLGRTFQLGGVALGPYARYDFATTDIDGYRETMSRPNANGAGLAVAIDGQDYDSHILALGAQAYTDFRAGSTLLVPQVSAEYVHEYDNDNEPITGRFVDALSDTSFSIPTDDPDRDYFNVGAGLTAFVQDDLQLYLQYQAQLGYADLDLYNVQAGMKVDF